MIIIFSLSDVCLARSEIYNRYWLKKLIIGFKVNYFGKNGKKQKSTIITNQNSSQTLPFEKLKYWNFLLLCIEWNMFIDIRRQTQQLLAARPWGNKEVGIHYDGDTVASWCSGETLPTQY